MTVQTSYALDKALGLPGCVADTYPSGKDSKLAVAAVPFGRCVVRRAAETAEQCNLPSASTDVTARPRGISVLDATRKPGTAYEANDAVTYLRKGRIWVEVEAAVAVDGDVFVRFAAGAGGTALGAFRGDADTATAVALPTAKFLTATSGAGLALVEVNLP